MCVKNKSAQFICLFNLCIYLTIWSLSLPDSILATLTSVHLGVFVFISLLTNNSLSSKYIISIIQSSLSFIKITLKSPKSPNTKSHKSLLSLPIMPSQCLTPLCCTFPQPSQHFLPTTPATRSVHSAINLIYKQTQLRNIKSYTQTHKSVLLNSCIIS